MNWQEIKKEELVEKFHRKIYPLWDGEPRIDRTTIHADTDQLWSWVESTISQLLKEQREICAKKGKVKIRDTETKGSYLIGGYGQMFIVDEDSILNAPEPNKEGK